MYYFVLIMARGHTSIIFLYTWLNCDLFYFHSWNISKFIPKDKRADCRRYIYRCGLISKYFHGTITLLHDIFVIGLFINISSWLTRIWQFLACSQRFLICIQSNLLLKIAWNDRGKNRFISWNPLDTGLIYWWPNLKLWHDCHKKTFLSAIYMCKNFICSIRNICTT